MIELADVTHNIQIGPVPQRVLTKVSLRIPTNRQIAFMGATPAARNGVLELLSGMILPAKGFVTRHGNVSFPVGFLGGFDPELTIRQNVELLAELYDQNATEVVECAARCSGLGAVFDLPFGMLPRDKRRHLGSIVGFSMPFDVYLLTAGRKQMNNPAFRDFYELFKARAMTKGMIVSTDAQFARLHCDMAMVVRLGRIELFEDVEKAISLADADSSAQIEESLETELIEQPRMVDDWV